MPGSISIGLIETGAIGVGPPVQGTTGISETSNDTSRDRLAADISTISRSHRWVVVCVRGKLVQEDGEQR